MPIATEPDQPALQAALRDCLRMTARTGPVLAAGTGGTTQILLNQVGERVLGLPR